MLTLVSMKDYTHIGIVLDRSGSMSGLKEEIIGGFNAFLDDQKKVEGKATVTLAQFDHEIERLADFEPLAEVKPLTGKTYVPRGMTSLHDAIGLTVVYCDQRIKKLAKKKRPGKILVLVLTDGFENNSTEYTNGKIRDLIQSKEKEGWEFSFIGANQDAVMTGAGLGISNTAANITMAANAEGAGVMMRSMSAAVRCYRSAPSGQAFAYSEDDRKAQYAAMKKPVGATPVKASQSERSSVIGAAGGKARAQSLSAQQRSDIASRAAKARWSKQED